MGLTIIGLLSGPGAGLTEEDVDVTVGMTGRGCVAGPIAGVPMGAGSCIQEYRLWPCARLCQSSFV